jgi:hypothetical protein
MSRRFDSYMALLVCEQMASRHGQNTAKAFALGAREPGRAHDRASPTPKSTSGTRRYSEHRRCLSKPLCAPLRGSWSPNAARATSGRLCAAAVVRSACPCVRLSRAARTHTHTCSPQHGSWEKGQSRAGWLTMCHGARRVEVPAKPASRERDPPSLHRWRPTTCKGRRGSSAGAASPLRLIAQRMPAATSTTRTIR